MVTSKALMSLLGKIKGRIKQMSGAKGNTSVYVMLAGAAIQ